jgi:hypothetical protein
MMKKRHVVEFTLALLMIAAIAPAYAVDLGQPKINGKTYGGWSATWLQWLESQDFAPLFEEGVVDCSKGQSGSVWFLAGTGDGDPGDPPVVRECTVPKKKLFFPLVNVWWHNESGEDLSVREKREVLDAFMRDDVPGLFNSRACNLHVTLNGDPALFSGVTIARTQSPPFSFAGDPETVIDGFWVVLRLPKGIHELHFHGALCDFATNVPFFEVDVIYNLTVE